MRLPDRELWRKEINKRVKSLRLLDDILFTKCFEGDLKCAELILRIILDMPALTVQEVRTQVLLANISGRSVRVDVLARGGDGQIFNIEIQRDDRGASSRRARFHSSALDTQFLEKSTDFASLPETYVIFITEHDVMGKGEPVYRIERYNLTTGEMFNDGSHIVYVNGAYRGDNPVGKLMHDFSCPEPSWMYYDELADRVRFYKETREGVDVMNSEFDEFVEKVYNEARDKGLEEGRAEGRKEGRTEGRAEGREEGRAEGRKEGRAEGREEGRAEGRTEGREEGRAEGRKEMYMWTARRLMADGSLTPEKIADLLELTESEVRNLADGA